MNMTNFLTSKSNIIEENNKVYGARSFWRRPWFQLSFF
jgi:hypothetical protein